MANWEMTRNKIVEAALRKLNVVSHGQTFEGWQMQTGIEALNNMVAGWTNEHSFFINTYQGTITTTAADYTYDLPLGVRYPRNLVVTVSGSVIPIKLKTQHDWQLETRKSTSGQPDTAYAINNDSSTNVGQVTLNLIPIPDATYTINYVGDIDFNYLNAADELGDFRPESYEAMIYNLAVTLAPEYDKERKIIDEYGRPTVIGRTADYTKRALFGTDAGKNNPGGLRIGIRRR